MKSVKYLIFCISLIACNAEKEKSSVPTVGFLDAFKDETLAQANAGFFDALKKAGYSEEDNTLKVIYRNAQGDIPVLTQAADYFIAQKVDLIAANPTLSVITALQKTNQIPVCTMVSSEPKLLNLTDKNGNPPPNMLGVWDNLDYIAASVKMIKDLIPNVKKLGMIYNQAEPQSVNAYNTILKQAKKSDFELIAIPVNNSSETQLVVEALIDKGIDAFFAMPDNVVFASFEVIYKSCNNAKIPVFTSEEGLVIRGSLAAYGADIYAWGYQAGETAVAYFKNKEIRLEKVKTYKKVINTAVAKEFGIKPDKSFLALGEKNKAAIKKETSQGYHNFYISSLMLGLAFASLGIGIFISMRIFDIPDITTDGSYTLGGILTAVLLIAQLPFYLVLPLILLAGSLAGICTGFIHAKLKINALLAGILVMTALYSVNLRIMGRSNIPLLDTANILNLLGNHLFAQLSVLVLITFFIALAVIYLLKTDFGLAMRATGNSETMIRANGVNTDRIKIIGLSISNALVAFSGFLIVQFQGFADINMGIGIVIIGLGSVMIGEALSSALGLYKIQYRILSVIIGTITFRLILALSLSLGLDPNLLKLVTALFVLLVVSIPNLKKLAKI